MREKEDPSREVQDSGTFSRRPLNALRPSDAPNAGMTTEKNDHRGGRSRDIRNGRSRRSLSGARAKGSCAVKVEGKQSSAARDEVKGEDRETGAAKDADREARDGVRDVDRESTEERDVAVDAIRG